MIKLSNTELIEEERVATPELLGEAIQTFRSRNESGLLAGERLNHRGWKPSTVLAFLNAPVIRPAKGELQRRLYPRSK